MSTVTNLVILSHEKEYSFVEEIKQYLRSADSSEMNKSQVSIILISSNLMADDLLLSIRKLAIDLHDEDKLEAIQVLIRSVYDHSTESKRKIYTIPETPISHIKDKRPYNYML